MALFFEKFKRICSLYKDKIALLDCSGNQVTYSQLYQKVLSFSEYLITLTKHKFDVVSTSTSDNFFSIVVCLACNRLNLTYLAVSPKHTKSKLNESLQYLGERVLLISIGSTKGELQWHFDPFHDTDIELFTPLIQRSTSDYTPSFKSNAFIYTFSSGSTGNPKLIGFSESAKYRRYKQAVQLFGITKQDTLLCASPFYHSLGQRLMFLTLLTGARLVLLEKFSPETYIQNIFRYKVTFVVPVASQIHAIAPFINYKDCRLTSLRAMVTSSALINEVVRKELIRKASFDFCEMYGASEVGTATLINFTKLNSKLNSVGTPCSQVTIKIMDESGNECPPFSIGEIWVKSKCSIGSYPFKDSPHNLNFIDGFFKTGDLGFLDTDNYLFFKGRMSELIITGGINVFPGYIEDKLLMYEDIGECCVISQDHFYLGEIPVAIIGGCQNIDLAKTMLRKLARKELATYERPYRYYFVDKLYTLPSGKVDKRRYSLELKSAPNESSNL